MKINLKNPLVIFDIESTGIDIVKDRIIEITYLKIFPDGREEEKTFRVNPQMPIPPKSTQIHGITDNDVKDCPSFGEVARTLSKVLEGADIAGYNSNRFDIPLLAEEFLRYDVDIDLRKRKFIDAQVIFHKMEQRTLCAAYKFYCNKDLENAHSSAADTRATFEILEAQIERYDNLQNDVDALSKFSSHNQNADYAGRIIYNEAGQEVFNFGKYKGQLVEDVLKKDTGYYGWMMNGDFPLYTKKVLTNIKLRMAFK